MRESLPCGCPTWYLASPRACHICFPCPALQYNKYLAEEARLRKNGASAAELQANNAEMEAAFTSQLLTEDPSIAASALSAYRVSLGETLECGRYPRMQEIP